MTKRILITLFFVVNYLFSNNIEISSSMININSNRLQNMYGIGLNYYYDFLSLNSLGISVECYNVNNSYSETANNSSESNLQYISILSSDIQRLSFRFSYLRKILNSDNLTLYLGPEIGYNHFIANDKGKLLIVNNFVIESNRDISNKEKLNKLGVGFLLKNEIKNIFSKRISFSINIRGEILTSNNIQLGGNSYPYHKAYKILEFGIGVKYNF